MVRIPGKTPKEKSNYFLTETKKQSQKKISKVING